MDCLDIQYDECHVDGEWCLEECEECDELAFNNFIDLEEAIVTGN